jgi:Family of unknown function (DUF6789)
MTVKGWIARSIVAGAAGTLVHFLFMYLKSRLGLLPAFQPYHSFQMALSRWLGSDVSAIVPWLLSFLNGMALIGLLFGRIFQRLPGRSGAAKGLSFGVIGWLFLNLAFFPLIDLGPFALRVGAGIGPALLSFGMLLTYSIVLGIVYVALDHGLKNSPQPITRRVESDF